LISCFLYSRILSITIDTHRCALSLATGPAAQFNDWSI
jgi:hypothetical protein